VKASELCQLQEQAFQLGQKECNCNLNNVFLCDILYTYYWFRRQLLGEGGGWKQVSESHGMCNPEAHFIAFFFEIHCLAYNQMVLASPWSL
jgi:hypothetical protein